MKKLFTILALSLSTLALNAEKPLDQKKASVLELLREKANEFQKSSYYEPAKQKAGELIERGKKELPGIAKQAREFFGFGSKK